MAKKISEIVMDSKKKGSISRIVEEEAQNAEEELKASRLRRLIAEEKAREREAKNQGVPLDPRRSRSFSEQIMNIAEVDPEKAKAILNALGPDDINKLATLNAMENDRAGAFLSLAKNTGTDVKDLIEIVKLTRPNNSITLEGMAKVFDSAINAVKSQGPPPDQKGMEYFWEKLISPFINRLSEKDKEVFDAKLDSVRRDIPPPLQQQIEHTRQVASMLGFGESKAKPEYDLKLEEMRQSHDIDMKKLEWEEKKYFLGQEAEREKWRAIQETFSPIFSMASPEIQRQLRNLGTEAGKALGGLGGNPNSNPNLASAQTPQVAPFTCPNCDQQMNVPYPLPQGVQGVKCPSCGTTTPIQYQGSEQPTTETPPLEETVKTLKPHYR